ncbi:MAG: hypothetical protein WC052_03360 [Patescibacteria group bacterium]
MHSPSSLILQGYEGHNMTTGLPAVARRAKAGGDEGSRTPV